MSWSLDDAEQRRREAPDTFFIPPVELRESLRPGQLVKLLVVDLDADLEERVWVEVLACAEQSYTGVLRSRPRAVEGLQEGDCVRFRAEHVAAVAYTEQELGYSAAEPAIVTRRIRDEGAWPAMLLYRPPGDQDRAGWQILVGDETEHELEHPDSAIVWPLGYLTDRFPAMAEPFRAPRAGYWDWHPPSGTYRHESEELG